MIYPSADALENWGSKYSLVVLAAKRAKQIKSGAPPMIETTSRNPITIALEEIAAGKIQCQVPDHDILPKTTQEAEVAQLLAIPTLAAEEEEDTEAVALAGETDIITDEDELLEEEDEEEEIEEEPLPVGDFQDDEEVEEEAEEEEPYGLEADAEEEQASEDISILADPEEPKPKRGRKKKAVEPDVDSSDDLGLGADEAEE